MSGKDEGLIRCPFCGHEFRESESRVACAGNCPLAGTCGRTRCPRCGYEIFPDPGWLKALRNWWGRRGRRGRPGRYGHRGWAGEQGQPAGGGRRGGRRGGPAGRPQPSGPAIRLADMAVGQTGVIGPLGGASARNLRKLMALGVTPGTRVRLVRRFPSYVMRLGFTQVAVDREIAEEIPVELDA